MVRFGLHMRKVGDAVELGGVNDHRGDNVATAPSTGRCVADDLEDRLSSHDLYPGDRHVQSCGDWTGNEELSRTPREGRL